MRIWTIIIVILPFLWSCDKGEKMLSEAEKVEQVLIENEWSFLKNTVEIQSDCLGDTSIFGQRNLDFTEEYLLAFIKPNGNRILTYGDFDRIKWKYDHAAREIVLAPFIEEEVSDDIIFTDVTISASLLKFQNYIPPSFDSPFCDNTEHKSIIEYKPK